MKRSVAGLVACLTFSGTLMLWGLAQKACAVPYNIIDLGTLGGSESRAFGVNSSGQVVGYSYLRGEALRHAFLYDGSKMIDLGTLGHPDGNSEARDINDNGDVVGWANVTSGERHAFLYSDSMMRDLGTLGGAYSWASGINNSAWVCGYGDLPWPAGHAFRARPPDYILEDLGTLGAGGGGSSAASRINTNGHVVGWSQRSGTSYLWGHAFVCAGSTMIDLGTLGGSNSWAEAINDSGHVAGYSQLSGDTRCHAFLYDGSTMTDLGTLGGSESWARAINAKGEVVGDAYDSLGRYRAFLYSGGTMTDLNTLIDPTSGWTLLRIAYDINDAGQIVGYGTHEGATHAFLMTPIPEPATLTLLLASGAACFLWCALRRRAGATGATPRVESCLGSARIAGPAIWH